MAEEFTDNTVDQHSNPPVDTGSGVASNEPVQSQTAVNEGTAAASAAPASSSQQATGQVGQGQAAADNWQSIRQAAYEQYGLDLRNLPDDGAALRHLIGQASQAQQAQQYAQRYLQHASQFEQWLGQQQQQQAAQQPKPAHWNPPEYNANWQQLVTRDPDTGEFKLAAGAPADVLPKLLAYEQYKREFANRLTSDPVNTLKPFIREEAQQIAQAMVQQHLGSYQDQVFADNYVSQNSGWLHQRDQQGNVVLDPFSRQPMLSPAGQLFKGYVEQLQSAGITNLRIQEQQARAMVERDLAMAQLAQLKQGDKNNQIRNQFLTQNNTRNPNQSGAISPGAPTNARLSLADRLNQNFRKEGITDADFGLVATRAN